MSLVQAILSGQTAVALDTFDRTLRDKIDDRLNEQFEQTDLSEGLKAKMVVRKGRVKCRWTIEGGSKLRVRGQEYAARRAEIDPFTGKRKEVKRTEEEIRSKAIKMKRRWRTTMRAKLPQLLRNRLRSMKIAQHL